MDFFQQQDKARRKTGMLALYFILAVLFIVVAVNLAFYFFFKFTEFYPYTPQTWFSDTIWLYVTGATIAVICLGSLFSFIKLAGGGQAVAEMAGGRLVDLSTKDKDERVYINVVEEMSIASGVPMPVLYIMDHEEGINAFVAGYKATEAVMVVTKGALKTLNRDELQGVIGHEFSHILNGDMRINVRLIAILAGILLIGKIGEFLLRGNRRSHYSSSRSSKEGQGALIVLALALLIIGYIGLFFGRLIKAAISRQREYLADASAVQFTRNPGGIAGALFKIRESISGTLLNTSHAEDMSHMCFGETIHVSLSGLLATHPPLDDRINAIDPNFLKIERSKEIIKERKQQTVPQTASGFAGEGGVTTNAAQITESVGNPTPEHVAYAVMLHQAIPIFLLEQIHKPDTAKSVIYALLLSAISDEHKTALLDQYDELNYINEMQKEFSVINDIDKRQRLPLIDLALPSLKMLTRQDKQIFLETVSVIIKADKKFTLFEFVLVTILTQHLNPKAEHIDRTKYFSFKPVIEDIQLILSVLVHCGAQSKENKAVNFQRCMSGFSHKAYSIIDLRQSTPKNIGKSLQRLSALSPMLKKSVIDACADAVIDDSIIMPAEAELLRAVAETLDCPMPPLLPH